MKARISGPTAASSSVACREAFVEHANHGAVFRVYLLGRQLLIDRPHDGRHPRLARRGTLKSRLDMSWVRQRCHEAPAKTVAVASFSPPWASEVTRSASRALPRSAGPYRATAHASPHSPAPRLSPRRLSTPPRNRPHRDGQREDAGAAIARKDGRGYGYLWGAPRRSQSRRLAAVPRHSHRADAAFPPPRNAICTGDAPAN